MRTTLKTIADHVGLSVASVSLVLNNKPNKLSPESRQKILAAAEELHYAPQLVSPAMAKKYSKTLGLIVPEVSNSFFADLAQGVGHCAQENGCQLLLSTTDGIAENDTDCLLPGTLPPCYLLLLPIATPHFWKVCPSLLSRWTARIRP